MHPVCPRERERHLLRLPGPHANGSGIAHRRYTTPLIMLCFTHLFTARNSRRPHLSCCESARRSTRRAQTSVRSPDFTLGSASSSTVLAYFPPLSFSLWQWPCPRKALPSDRTRLDCFAHAIFFFFCQLYIFGNSSKSFFLHVYLFLVLLNPIWTADKIQSTRPQQSTRVLVQLRANAIQIKNSHLHSRKTFAETHHKLYLRWHWTESTSICQMESFVTSPLSAILTRPPASSHNNPIFSASNITRITPISLAQWKR